MTFTGRVGYMKDIKWIHFSLNQIEELVCKYAFMHFICFINLLGLARGFALLFGLRQIIQKPKNSRAQFPSIVHHIHMVQ
jgi:hypothetical protein